MDTSSHAKSKIAISIDEDLYTELGITDADKMLINFKMANKKNQKEPGDCSPGKMDIKNF